MIAKADIFFENRYKDKHIKIRMYSLFGFNFTIIIKVLNIHCRRSNSEISVYKAVQTITSMKIFRRRLSFIFF